jgi:hypothetical protein
MASFLPCKGGAEKSEIDYGRDKILIFGRNIKDTAVNKILMCRYLCDTSIGQVYRVVFAQYIVAFGQKLSKKVIFEYLKTGDKKRCLHSLVIYMIRCRI